MRIDGRTRANLKEFSTSGGKLFLFVFISTHSQSNDRPLNCQLIHVSIMDPFATSKVIKFLLSKLKVEFDSSEVSHNYEKELDNLLRRGENHISSNHVRLFSREQTSQVSALIDPSYGQRKIKATGVAIKSYHVNVRNRSSAN